MVAEKCNSCGAEIEYVAGSQSLKCPYCATVNKIQKAEDQLPDIVEKIIPLTVSLDDLKKWVYGYMARGIYTPDDMLEGATFTKQECFYVPAFLFHVEYEATWTASFGYNSREPYTAYRTVTRDGQSFREAYTAYRQVTDWRPANGVDRGILSVSRYAGKMLSKVALTPSDIVPLTIASGNITDFNPSFMKGVQAEEFTVPEASAFSASESEINVTIGQNVQRHGQGDRQKDWHWNARMAHSTNTLYVPICHAKFDYKGTEYHFWMDGIGKSVLRADVLPEDKDKKKLVYLGFIPAVVASIGLLAASLIWEFTWPGLAAAALFWGYAAMRRSSILGYSKAVRDSLLTQIHASSSATKDMSPEEGDRRAKAFQRPEKPFFATTHQDKVMLPVLSIVALLCIIIVSYLGSRSVLTSSEPTQLSLSQSQSTSPDNAITSPSEEPQVATPQSPDPDIAQQGSQDGLIPHGNVNDFANLLDKDVQAQINAVAGNLNRTVHVHIAIVTLSSLEGRSIEESALQLSDRYGVGSNPYNRGVLVLLAEKEHKYRIAVGQGLGSMLPDTLVASLGLEMVPMLQQNDYGGALLHVTKRISQVLTDGGSRSESGSGTPAYKKEDTRIKLTCPLFPHTS